MMSIVPSTHIRETVAECFSLDQALISKFHIYSGKGLDACIEKTVDDLEAAPELSFFLLMDEEALVGYFGKESSNYLSTIFIHPKYRDRESIGKVWNQICSEFPSEFYTSIFKKNEPAVRFFTRNGTQIDEFSLGTDKALAFKFTTGEILCP